MFLGYIVRFLFIDENLIFFFLELEKLDLYLMDMFFFFLLKLNVVFYFICVLVLEFFKFLLKVFRRWIKVI